VILDAAPVDVPERYRETDRARQLVSVVADGVERNGIVVCPAKEWEVQDRARDAGCRVAVFSTADDVTERDTRVAHAVALVRGGRIVFEQGGLAEDGGALRDGVPAAAQVAGALAVRSLEELRPEVLRADAAA
jgi:cyanophycin synthetase